MPFSRVPTSWWPVQQPGQQDGRAEAAHGAGERADQAAAGRLDRAPQEHRRLQPLAADGQEGGEGERARAEGERRVQPVVQLEPEGAGGPPHPEHHPGHEADGDDREQAGEQLLGREGERGGGELEGGPDGQAERDRGRHPQPHRAEAVAVAGLDQVGDQDADDQGGLQALAQPDEVVRHHVGEHRDSRRRLVVRLA
jgi:hypothetical protein